ncbi:DUF2789 domain-containing protein [Halopseudomonas bauzanensis]|uniref:DUF2789 domain-containing protein n=1 Tax=Halopseudomonas bauzanensis TaxID=653930 RepID=A0A1H9R3A9_9GAMM|nr:DUF2789 domain-containing protein [Halopseudomonas bauzanensis]SER67202.1 Protein of unknown function [Halopseudomonas bauzanensis]SFL61251.1 Protein of unknown function [Halopseudomonas bauzanensis]
MELPNKDLGDLFDQLGLSSTPEDIEAFFASHSLPPDIKLIDAPFWTPTQALFLKEEMREDAEWAPIVDQLNVRLHED